EVGVSRTVDQVDLDLVVHDRRQRQVDRTLLALLGLVVVADGGTVGDAAGSGDGPGGHQERLDERGLTGPGGADERDVADVELVGCWCSGLCRAPCRIACSHGASLQFPATPAVARAHRCAALVRPVMATLLPEP